jgi:hypothetical protein
LLDYKKIKFIKMEETKNIVVYINDKPSFQLSVKNTTNIGSIKSILDKYDSIVTMYINKKLN